MSILDITIQAFSFTVKLTPFKTKIRKPINPSDTLIETSRAKPMAELTARPAWKRAFGFEGNLPPPKLFSYEFASILEKGLLSNIGFEGNSAPPMCAPEAKFSVTVEKENG